MEESGDMYALVDARRVKPTETVLCAAGWKHGDRWAQFHVTARIPPQIIGKPELSMYMCQSCLEGFLIQAERLGVG